MLKKDKRKQKEFMGYYQPVHENFVRFCQARARGVMNYQDLVSEATLKAYQSWDKIRNKDALKYFLFSTARNIVLNALRKRAELSLEAVRLEPETSSAIETDLQVEYLYQQLDKLSDIKREAIILFEINGFSIKEIADIQGIKEGAVKVNLSRARKRTDAIDAGRAGLKQRNSNKLNHECRK